MALLRFLIGRVGNIDFSSARLQMMRNAPEGLLYRLAWKRPLSRSAPMHRRTRLAPTSSLPAVPLPDNLSDECWSGFCIRGHGCVRRTNGRSPAGVPGFTVYTRVEPIYFLETPKQVVIVNQLNQQFRHIYLDVPHSAKVVPSWYGESVGHYEGDELVVDTIGLNDKTTVDNYRTPHTDQIHVVERFKMIEDGEILQAVVTVDDPGAFNTPWTAVQRWRRVEREMPEDICAENNLAFFDYDVVPIPQAKQSDF